MGDGVYIYMCIWLKRDGVGVRYPARQHGVALAVDLVI